MANPLYLFFASRAGLSASVLRWTLAAFLFYSAIWHAQILLGQGNTLDKSLILPWISGTDRMEWSEVLLQFLAGFFLLIGFCARFFSFSFVVLLLWSTVGHPLPAGIVLRELFLYATLCIASTIAGAGWLSLDQKISTYLQPSF